MSKSKGGGGRQAKGGGSSQVIQKPTLTPAQIYEQKAREIVDYPIEHGVTIGKDGTVIETTGTSIKVISTKEQMEAMRNGEVAISLHNHPNGQSLSPQDYNFAFYNNLDREIAIGRDPLTGKIYAHEFTKPPGGYTVSPSKVARSFKIAERKVLQRR